MSATFGPAGNAESFPYKSSVDAPRWLREIGLDCYEYQCGKGVNVGEATARKIGLAAVEQGVLINHAAWWLVVLAAALEPLGGVVMLLLNTGYHRHKE